MSSVAAAQSPLWALPRLRAQQLGWMVPPVVIFVATRGIVALAGYLANVALPSSVGEGFYHSMPSNIFLDIWSRWDSAYYLVIAQTGYGLSEGQLRDVAFFPLYPLLLKLVGSMTNNFVVAGVLVSNISFLGALLILDRLTHLEFGDSGTSERTVFYMAAFPSSVFFSAIYTESTFLLLAIATMYCARRHWWLAAGTFGALASATRVIGIVLLPVLVVEWLAWHGWSLSTLRDPVARRRLLTQSLRDSRSLLAVSLAPLGLVSYSIFLGVSFDDPLAFLTAQTLWSRETRGPVYSVLRTLDDLKWGDWLTGTNLIWTGALDLVSLAFALGVGICVFRRLGAGYGLLTILGVLIPAWAGTVSMYRFVAVLFPLFMMLGLWGRRPLVDRALSAVFLVLLGVSTAVFVNWNFLG